MNYKEYNLGEGSPHIAVVGVVHGDEILGQKVVNKLRNIRLKKGSLSLIVAHPTALAKKKRFFKYDLNRSFPGKKNGQAEHRLAYKLHRRLKTFDIVLDIHTTNADIQSLAIVTRLNRPTKDLLKLIPIKQVALARKRVFNGRELIAHCRTAVSLDYGLRKNGVVLKRALDDVKSVLKNLSMVEGKSSTYHKKDIYIITEPYRVRRSFKYSQRVHEFQLIKKGDIIGCDKDAPIRAAYSFYPLFLHNGHYKNTFALAARTKRNIAL